MGVTTTPNFGLNKPDLAESMGNWSTQNSSDCDAVDAVSIVTSGTYSPNLLASDVNPTLNSSTLTGHWVKPVPNFIWVYIVLVIGSDFDPGDGVYAFSLPEDAHALYDRTNFTSGGVVFGKAVKRNGSSIPASRTGVVLLNDPVGPTDEVRIKSEEGEGHISGSDSFSNGDRVRLGCSYVTAT